MYPDLQEDVSDALRKRMQRKSCSNVTRIVPELREELENLTRKGYDRPGAGKGI